MSSAPADTKTARRRRNGTISMMSLATPTPIDQPASLVRVNAPLSGIPSSLALKRCRFVFRKRQRTRCAAVARSRSGGAARAPDDFAFAVDRTHGHPSLGQHSLSQRLGKALYGYDQFQRVWIVADRGDGDRDHSSRVAGRGERIGYRRRPVGRVSRRPSASSSCTGTAAEDGAWRRSPGRHYRPTLSSSP